MDRSPSFSPISSSSSESEDGEPATKTTAPFPTRVTKTTKRSKLTTMERNGPKSKAGLRTSQAPTQSSPPTVVNSTASTSQAIIPIAPMPDPKFHAGNVALIRTKQTIAMTHSVLVAIESSDYDNTKQQWRYVCCAELFEDPGTTINVWENNLVKPRYQIDEVIWRPLFNSMKIRGVVKCVKLRNNVFEYEIEWNSSWATDDDF